MALRVTAMTRTGGAEKGWITSRTAPEAAQCLSSAVAEGFSATPLLTRGTPHTKRPGLRRSKPRLAQAQRFAA